MSVASEVHTSLRSMGFVQLFLAIVFLTCYSVACSTLFEGRGRLRAAGVAIAAAVGFIAFTNPWVHGVLMLAGAVGGLGLFAAISWVLSNALNLPASRPATELPDAQADIVVEPAASNSAPRAPTVTRIPAA